MCAHLFYKMFFFMLKKSLNTENCFPFFHVCNKRRTGLQHCFLLIYHWDLSYRTYSKYIIQSDMSGLLRAFVETAFYLNLLISKFKTTCLCMCLTFFQYKSVLFHRHPLHKIALHLFWWSIMTFFCSIK